MRRLLAVAALLATTGAVVLAGVGAGEEDAYRVRAIFDNAGFVIPGEDVKVAGVRVGAIESIEVTDDFRAAVVLGIEDPAYRDFRADASCIVRPQSLIGEKFVECEPTQKRSVGQPLPPPLRRLDNGDHLLPVENTKQAVDLDLLNTVFRRPYAERLTIVLNELGTGLAGRGRDLNAVIRRSAPALTEVGKVLRLLSRQNRRLRQLAVDSDTILRPLARERKRVSGFIESSSEVAQAAAERREALEGGIARLPAALRELRPTMDALRELSGEMTPVLADLGDVAPEINRLILDLGPFSEAAGPALDRLGDAARAGVPALRSSLPVVTDLRSAAKNLRPNADLLAKVAVSLQKSKGFERLMDYIFFQVAAINGFDSFGHYLRAAIMVNRCSAYSIQPVSGCSARFSDPPPTGSAATGLPRDQTLAKVRRILAGEPVEKVLGAGERPSTQSLLTESAATGIGRTRTPRTQPALTEVRPRRDAERSPRREPVEDLMDYLFGDPG